MRDSIEDAAAGKINYAVKLPKREKKSPQTEQAARAERSEREDRGGDWRGTKAKRDASPKRRKERN
jgi:hypothetical protein